MLIDYKIPSIVRVSNIYAEDLFQWFYTHTMDSCGDGTGTIVCYNYKEVADWFKEWHSVKYPDSHKWFHPKDCYKDMVSFHDSNESFSFTNKFPLLYECYGGDYVFIVEQDCVFAHSDNIIKKV